MGVLVGVGGVSPGCNVLVGVGVCVDVGVWVGVGVAVGTGVSVGGTGVAVGGTGVADNVAVGVAAGAQLVSTSTMIAQLAAILVHRFTLAFIVFSLSFAGWGESIRGCKPPQSNSVVVTDSNSSRTLRKGEAVGRYAKPSAA
jgi:hypothetical protein